MAESLDAERLHSGCGWIVSWGPDDPGWAGEGADGAAVALAGDLARLRHPVLGLTFNGPTDVNVHESITAHVQPHREGEVTVIGRLTVGLDYEATKEHP